jgi:hypothetical protein
MIATSYRTLLLPSPSVKVCHVKLWLVVSGFSVPGPGGKSAQLINIPTNANNNIAIREVN